MRVVCFFLVSAICFQMAGPARAAGCQSYFETARKAAGRAESGEYGINADRKNVISGGKMRDAPTIYACLDLSRYYRRVQDVMNAYNEAGYNFSKAASACDPEYAADLWDRVALAHKRSGAIRDDLNEIAQIGRASDCAGY